MREKRQASINSYLILENPQNVDVLVVVLVLESNLKVSVICTMLWFNFIPGLNFSFPFGAGGGGYGSV